MNNKEMKEKFLEISLEDELKESYLNYAMSVIVARALPDARDGLKPSQRRILVAMNDLGLSPRSKFRKCAKICGDTSGNYHPHGEMVIYPTLVHMAQTFAMRYPLIEGQGNFGSIDGDPPAAMRYTEARLTDYTMLLLEDLDKNTVDFVPNYDETRKEPVVLPSKFPNLICNGSSGIAVGMATNIPPHNFLEVADAIIKLLDNPNVSIEELMESIKGPDFPTGGAIIGTEGIKQAYKTGKGRIIVRGKLDIEEAKSGKKSIVITEIPYNVNKSSLIERIAALAEADKIQGVADIRDESDKEGIRIVIELRKEADENVIINQLYQNTQLQDTFSIILLALVNNKPKLLNLKQILEEYRDFRIEVIRRRTKFLLEKVEAEIHILEGLVKAISVIDEIIRLIKSSHDVDEAKVKLVRKFDFTEKQAEAILRMSLAKLTALEYNNLVSELEKKREEAREYKAILADENLIIDIIREDIYEMKERFSDDRRLTKIYEEEYRKAEIEELIAKEEMVVTITNAGYIKRIPLDSYHRQARGGKGVSAQDLKLGDMIQYILVASTHDTILLFTNFGKVYSFKVYELPLLSRTSKGRHISNLLNIRTDERTTSMCRIDNFQSNFIFMATKFGTVKRTAAEVFQGVKKGGIYAITLEENDELVGALATTGSSEVIISTRKGMSIRLKETSVRSMGRTARGVRGISLEEDDSVVGLILVEENNFLLTVSENGFGKRTSFNEYRLQNRGGKGVLTFKCTEKTGNVIGVATVADDDEIFIATKQGQIIRIACNTIRQTGRIAQGVRLLKLNENDKVSAINKVYYIE